MSDPGPQHASPVPRVRAIRDGFLTAVYQRDYYKEIQAETILWARRWDFIIGLGAAMSGGSGLGILAHPQFAWLCGTFTTASVILTVAKSAFDWPGTLKTASDRVQDYSALAARYRMLIDDLNYLRKWSDEHEKRYQELRQAAAQIPEDAIKPLPVNKQKQIQAAIKQRIDYSAWWSGE